MPHHGASTVPTLLAASHCTRTPRICRSRRLGGTAISRRDVGLRMPHHGASLQQTPSRHPRVSCVEPWRSCPAAAVPRTLCARQSADARAPGGRRAATAAAPSWRSGGWPPAGRRSHHQAPASAPPPSAHGSDACGLCGAGVPRRQCRALPRQRAPEYSLGAHLRPQALRPSCADQWGCGQSAARSGVHRLRGAPGRPGGNRLPPPNRSYGSPCQQRPG
mmetsp:Transcript_135723/g.378119  ORF Transcript_135723/g.378119 Transcript_135723/m.378119 type:complete len:219 (-) Transcript_135723:728-1384(-)